MLNYNNKIDFIINSFIQKEIIIILISYQIKKNVISIQFQNDSSNQFVRNKFLKLDEVNSYKLLDQHILNINKILKNEISKYNKRIFLIIFTEYFFLEFLLMKKKEIKL